MIRDALIKAEFEIDMLWKDTHGCKKCAEILGYGSDEPSPVASDCPECNGHGVVV